MAILTFFKFGGRLSNVIEEIKSEDTIHVDELVLGEPGLLFSVIGDMGCGKTSLLLHLNWKVNITNQYVSHLFKDVDKTWSYWNLHNDVDGNPINLNRHGHRPWISDRDSVPKSPDAFVGIYVQAIDLLPQAIESDKTIPIKQIIESSYTTYVNRENNLDAQTTSHSDYVSAYTDAISHGKITAVYLFVDALDLIQDRRKRIGLMQQLNETVQDPCSCVFRVFFSSRKYALFKLGEIPENTQFLYLDMLDDVRAEKLCKSISPKVAQEMNKPQKKEIFSRTMRNCHSPLMAFIVAKLLQEGEAIPTSLFALFEKIIKKLEVQAIRNDPSKQKSFEKRYAGHVHVSEADFEQLVGLVAFFCLCWLPMSWDGKWSTRVSFQSILRLILTHYSSKLDTTFLGKLKKEYIKKYTEKADIENIKLAEKKAITMLCKAIWNSVASYMADIQLARLHFSQALEFESSNIEYGEEDVNDIQILDLQLLQFLVARFLTSSKVGSYLVDSLSYMNLENPEFISEAPGLFNWESNTHLTDDCWGYVFDLMSSKMGVVWMSGHILKKSKSIFDWLAELRTTKGVDPNDLGQIRFYRLLKGFALQIEDQMLTSEYQLKKAGGKEDNVTNTLRDSIGITLYSLIENNVTAIIHLEKRPALFLKSFSQKGANLVIDLLFDILKRGTMLTVADLLINIEQQGFVSNTQIQKLVEFVKSSKERLSVRPAIRFLSSTVTAHKHIRLFIECLSIKIQDSQEESVNAISKLAHESLNLVVESMVDKLDNIYPADNQTFPIYTKNQTRYQFLFTNEEWSLYIRSSIFLLVDFVCLGIHQSKKNMNYYNLAIEPKARVYQCKRIKTLLSMMEGDSPGCRILPFILLGNCDKSNNFNPEEEMKYLDSQLLILQSLSEEYVPFRQASQSQEISSSMKGIYNIINDLFGPQAAKHFTLLEDLIKSSGHFLHALNIWCISHLDAKKRSPICQTLLQNRNLRIQKDTIQLMYKSQHVIDSLETSDLTAVVSYGLTKRDTRSFIRREALKFLEITSSKASNHEYRMRCVEQVVLLFGRFGAYDPVTTEPLLRILESILKKNLPADQQDEIITLLKRKNIPKILIESFPKQMSWVSKTVIGTIHQYFVSYDDNTVFDFINLMTSEVPALRYVALEQLKRVDISIIPALIQSSIQQISNDDPKIRTMHITLLGTLGRREDVHSLVVDNLLSLINQYKNTTNLVSYGIQTISIMGKTCKDDTDILNLIFDLIKLKLDTLKSHDNLLREDISLLQTIVLCVGSIGFCSEPMVTQLVEMLRDVPDAGLMMSIFMVLNNLACKISEESKVKHEETLFTLLQHSDAFVRELGIKIIRGFGTSTVKHSVSRLVKLISDSGTFARKQALKSISFLMKNADVRMRKDALLLLPAIVSALEDKNPMVVIEALTALRRFKSPTGNSSSVKKSSQTIPIQEIDNDSSDLLNQSKPSRSRSRLSANEDDENSFFLSRVIKPNIERIVALLNRKRYKLHTGVKIAIFQLLGESKLLTTHIRHFEDLFNSDNATILYEFGDVFKNMGFNFIQYVPSILSILKPSSPLVRIISRIITSYECKIDPIYCSKVFDTTTLVSLTRNKDSNVRKTAVSLLGKKVIEKPKNLRLLIQMWSDKVYKVRKEVMEVLGDLGRKKPELIPEIMETIDTESMNSVMIWKFLSKSWGILIKNNSTILTNFE